MAVLIGVLGLMIATIIGAATLIGAPWGATGIAIALCSSLLLGGGMLVVGAGVLFLQRDLDVFTTMMSLLFFFGGIALFGFAAHETGIALWLWSNWPRGGPV